MLSYHAWRQNYSDAESAARAAYIMYVSAANNLKSARKDLRAVSKERDEADRFAGAAAREIESLKDTASRRQDWLTQAKADWGVSDSVSFDDVWREALVTRAERDEQAAKVAAVLRLLDRLQNRKRSGKSIIDPEGYQLLEQIGALLGQDGPEEAAKALARIQEAGEQQGS